MRDDKHCTLCGRDVREVGKVILGVNGGVCVPCVYLCLELIQSDPAFEKAAGSREMLPEPPVL